MFVGVAVGCSFVVVGSWLLFIIAIAVVVCCRLLVVAVCCCVWLLVVVVCYCMLLFVGVCCCSSLFVVVCRRLLMSLGRRWLLLFFDAARIRFSRGA